MSLEFIDLYKLIDGRTLLTPDRCWHLYRLARETVKVQGDMAECGVYRGGSAKLISKAVHHHKSLFCFDTFAGIPAEQRKDGEHTAGDFTADYAEVRSYLDDCKRVALFKGLVPDVLQEVRNRKFSFVYLDMDLYTPTYSALQFFWERLNTGGCIVLDDVELLVGVTQAFKEFVDLLSVGTYDWRLTTVDQAVIFKK